MGKCTEDQVVQVIAVFPCQTVNFPIKYLGMSLSVNKLPKIALQPLIDRMADPLPAWKGHLMHCSGRLTLIKITLVATPGLHGDQLPINSMAAQGDDQNFQSFQ
jgi:hypothetical protein